MGRGNHRPFPDIPGSQPSGTGEKLFFVYSWGDIGTLRNRKLLEPTAFGRQFKVPGGQGHAAGIEIYLASRFFTVTWHQASPDDVLRRAACADLEWVIATAGPALKGKPSARANGHAHSGAHDGARDESRSAIAFRLVRQLARTGATREDIDATFRTAADWLTDKGLRNGEREWTRTLDRAVPPTASTERQGDTDAVDPSEGLYDPWNALQPARFPTEVLSPVARDFVEATARNLGCDEGGLAMAALSACSASLDGRIRINLKRKSEYLQPGIIWAGLVARPSAKKSPVMQAALGPLEAAQKDDNTAYSDALRAWKALPKQQRAEQSEPHRHASSLSTTRRPMPWPW